MSDMHVERLDQPGDIRPVPDPTTLTDRLVNSAVGNLEARILVRLDGMEQATALRLVEFQKIPDQTAVEITHLRELLETAIDEKFKGVALQFTERDVRTANEKTASASALDAALKAAKEQGELTNKANTEANQKAEFNFTKQIDATAALIEANRKAAEAQIADLKERIGNVESGNRGALAFRSNQRLDTGSYVGILLAVVAIVAVGVSIATVLVQGG